MPIRTYQCKRCRKEADYSEDKPRCKTCGSRKLDWRPKAGHGGLLKTLKANDGYFKRMAEVYGLTNLKSARIGECMQPDAPPLKTYEGPGYSPAPGVNMPVQMNGQGQIVGSCNTIPLDAIKPYIESPGEVTAPPKLPSLRESTIIEGRWSKGQGEKPGDLIK